MRETVPRVLLYQGIMRVRLDWIERKEVQASERKAHKQCIRKERNNMQGNKT